MKPELRWLDVMLNGKMVKINSKGKSKVKKRKTAKRKRQLKNKHRCQWEYSPDHSTPDQTVFICTGRNEIECDGTIVEHEDAGTGA